MTIKAILFDKDGTLIDFSATFGPATRLVIEDLAAGNADKAKDLSRAIGFDAQTCSFAADSVVIAGSIANIAETMLPHVKTMDQPSLTHELARLYDIHSLASLAPFEGLEETLHSLRQRGLILGIATNDAEHTAHAHVNQLGLGDCFSFIAGFDSGHGEKPHPGMANAFVEHTQLKAQEVIMVGDSVHDCRCAKAAGIQAIAVTSGLATKSQLASHADHVLAGIGELPLFIDHLNETPAKD